MTKTRPPSRQSHKRDSVPKRSAPIAKRAAKAVPAKAHAIRPDLLAGEDLPIAPRQRRSIAKRERLKAAALHLFGEHGFEGTSVDAVSERAELAVGSFYQHFRSKRQLLLVLMNDLLEKLSGLDFVVNAKGGRTKQPKAAKLADGPNFIYAKLHAMLARSFSHDLHYLGAYRAWQEAALSDPSLAEKQKQIQQWTSARVTYVFLLLSKMPEARPALDVAALARVMDSFFWGLLSQANTMAKAELDRSINAATHLIFHAIFADPH